MTGSTWVLVTLGSVALLAIGYTVRDIWKDSRDRRKRVARVRAQLDARPTREVDAS